MALGRVNLIDAIYWQVPVIAKNTTAITRIGAVKTTPANNLVTVTVGSSDMTCQMLKGQTLAINDVVLLLCNGSSWWVIGVIPPPPAE